MQTIILCLFIVFTAACSLTAATPAPTAQLTPLATSPQQTTPAQQATPQPPGHNPGLCTPRADWTTIYIVLPGDTLGGIANRTGSTVEALAEGNCLANVNRIVDGQALRVPQQPVPPTPSGSRGAQQLPEPRGGVTISSAISADAGNFMLLRGDTVTLTWDGAPSGMASAMFLIQPLGTQLSPAQPNTLIGEDTNAADGFSIRWNVPADLEHRVYAVGRSASGGETASSYPVSIYSAPPPEQGCFIIAGVDGVMVYMQPDPSSQVFGTMPVNTPIEVLGRSLNGWYGFDPGVSQAGNEGMARLRWVAIDAPLSFQGRC